MSRKFPASFRVFRRGCWNCILRVQGNILAKNSFISIFFFIFGHWAIFLTNSRKKSSGVVKTVFSVSMDTFGCKSFAKPTNCYFLEFRAEIFRLAVQKSQRGFQAAFYLSMGTISRKLFKKFLHLLWTFFGSFPVIGQEKPLSDCQNCIHCIYKIILKKKLF